MQFRSQRASVRSLLRPQYLQGHAQLLTFFSLNLPGLMFRPPRVQLRADIAIEQIEDIDIINLTSTIDENHNTCDSVALFPCIDISIHMSEEVALHSIAEEEHASISARALANQTDVNAQTINAINKIAVSTSDLANALVGSP